MSDSSAPHGSGIGSVQSETASARRGRRRWRRYLRVGGATVLVFVILAYGGVGWYVSNEIIGGLRVTPHVVEYDVDVLSIDGADIALGVPNEAATEWDRDAVMGLRWEGGYAQVGPASSTVDNREVRPITTLVGGLPPLGSGVADFDSFAFPEDPSVLGVDFDVVSYPSPLGNLEAWLVAGDGSTWIVAVHGRSADRTEYLRLIDATSNLRYPTLVIRYRNDPDSPSTGDSLIRFGQDEYADVAAAVDFALAHGASDVVVYGASMGGSLALSYGLQESKPVIRGMVLEAPAADLREIVQLKSGDALPVGGIVGDSFLAVGRLFVTARIGLDFDTVDYTGRASGLDMPILLFHGTEDDTVPYAISESFAAARPDLVEFHSIPDAAHVRAWNEDPASYARILAEFLERAGRSE